MFFFYYHTPPTPILQNGTMCVQISVLTCLETNQKYHTYINTYKYSQMPYEYLKNPSKCLVIIRKCLIIPRITSSVTYFTFEIFKEVFNHRFYVIIFKKGCYCTKTHWNEILFGISVILYWPNRNICQQCSNTGI